MALHYFRNHHAYHSIKMECVLIVIRKYYNNIPDIFPCMSEFSLALPPTVQKHISEFFLGVTLNCPAGISVSACVCYGPATYLVWTSRLPSRGWDSLQLPPKNLQMTKQEEKMDGSKICLSLGYSVRFSLLCLNSRWQQIHTLILICGCLKVCKIEAM